MQIEELTQEIRPVVRVLGLEGQIKVLYLILIRGKSLRVTPVMRRSAKVALRSMSCLHLCLSFSLEVDMLLPVLLP
jgi:hypothetical protein